MPAERADGPHCPSGVPQVRARVDRRPNLGRVGRRVPDGHNDLTPLDRGAGINSIASGNSGESVSDANSAAGGLAGKR